MARCKQCGASGLFLRVNEHGLCPDCAQKDMEIRLSISDKGLYRNEHVLPELQRKIEKLFSSVGKVPGIDANSVGAGFDAFQRAVDADTKLASMLKTASIAELQEQNQLADDLLTEATRAITALSEKEKAATLSAEPGNTSADEIMKYKQLLDAGAITQEEYDAKKKQLLGL